MSNLGVLLLDSVRSTQAAVRDRNQEHSTIVEKMRERLRSLHANLDTISFPEGRSRDKALEELAELASNSPIGKHLMAGELFLSFSAASASNLVRALGARSGLSVILDTSVAMPMLCAVFYGPVENRFSRAANHAFQQLQRHDVPIYLPLDYLEEVAAHLLNAYRDYRDIVDIDPDLTQSENAFVAHYSGLRAQGDDRTFVDYLASFGLEAKLHQADYYFARDALRPRLQRLFDRYSIEAKHFGTPSPASRKRAEEGIMFAANQLGIEKRPDILVRHDVRTLAALFDSDRRAEIAQILCTWDGIHFWVREREDTSSWHALSPTVLGDLLALAADEEISQPVTSAVAIAKSLSEDAAARGAAVWDRLVRIERGSLNDADLLEQARRFKADYIKRHQKGKADRDVAKDWATWKAKHFKERQAPAR